jgi:hypothetical protein
MFDLKRIVEQLDAAPLLAPMSPWIGAALIDDCARLGSGAPAERDFWPETLKDAKCQELIGTLAHFLAFTALRDETIGCFRASGASPDAAVRAFLAATEPLDAAMIRDNAFRREELLRQWVAAVGGVIAGETAAFSEKRLKQLDYRQALAEYARAEAERKAEAARRAAALAEAERRAQENSGWRE